MREIYKDDELEVPSGVTVDIKSRVITVKGPRGELVKAVKHIQISLRTLVSKRQGGSTKIKIVIWHGGRKHVACIRTIKSLIENMITGVTSGFLYKMRYVYAHFPINCIISDKKDHIEIRNFLGEKRVRAVNMLTGVSVEEDKNQKDQIIVFGNDLDNVSQSAASIQQACNVRHKDIRKFLDGESAQMSAGRR